MRIFPRSRKQLLLIATFTATLVFFNSCQKNISSETKTGYKTKVESWLNEQAALKGSEGKAIILQIKETLKFDLITSEKITDIESMIIVPISEKYTPRNNKDKPVTNYLVLKTDENNKIVIGNIVQYLPENKSVKAQLPNNTFHSLVNKKNVSGQFFFLSITDHYLSEMDFKDGRLYSFSLMKQKGKPTSTTSNSRTTIQECIDWFLVTTYTYPDGSTYTEEQYVGRTCGTDCTPVGPTVPQTLDCEDDGSGGTVIDCEIPDMENGTSVVSETISTTTSTVDAFTKNKYINWRIFKHPTWALHSYEAGVIKLVDVPSNKWEWQSLSHNSISFSGVSFGGTISHTNGVGTPSFTAGTPNVLYAGMSVNYNITFSPICNCLLIPAFTYNYTSTGLWDANP